MAGSNCVHRKAEKNWMNKPWAQRVVTADRQIRADHIRFFFFFKSKLKEWRTTVFHRDGYLFQTLYLIKKIVLNKHFYRNQEMAALFWLEKNSCTSGLMHNRKCNLEDWGGERFHCGACFWVPKQKPAPAEAQIPRTTARWDSRGSCF